MSTTVTSEALADLQCEVGRWHLDTFGEGDFALKIGRKLGEEVSELNQALGGMNEYVGSARGDHIRESVAPELADVAIGVMALACRLGVDLGAALTEKLGELRIRTE